MNHKKWKLIFVLPLCLCTLYTGGYIAQFIRNYKTWTNDGNFAGNGTSPQVPSLYPSDCFQALTSFPYNLYGLFVS